ncbi:MAG: hypothetical protein IID61_06170 [SAR324 cluster bacterium]|nr:hypothetical protein [SAR324 cluster bacterium]
MKSFQKIAIPVVGLMLAWASPLLAEEPSAYFRLYYAPYFTGTVEQSPADPDGDYSGKEADRAYKVDVELILFKFIGISATRIPFHRKFENADGQIVDESAEQRAVNLTLYATASRHNSWNLFIGGGLGSIDEYRIKVDRKRVGRKDPLFRDYKYQRTFAGVEYTFDRLGIRLEFTRESAERETNDGRKARLKQTFQYITFYIPFN